MLDLSLMPNHNGRADDPVRYTGVKVAIEHFVRGVLLPVVLLSSACMAPTMGTNPELQPFHRAFTLSTPEDLLGAQESFTVPAGKRLVIEFVTFHIPWPAGQETTFAWVAVSNSSGNQSPIDFIIPARFQANATNFAGNVWIWSASSPTRLYADPGTQVQVAVRRNVVGGTGLASVAISGHFVNVP